jgi:aryl-alcohol dehydrogenase-like predicted oxidoreductase
MRYGAIDGLDRPVSRIILGSMSFAPESQDLVNEIIEAYLDAGGNMIDTAHVYKGGGSERAIGEWLRRRGARDAVMILTKGAHHSARGKRVRPEEISFDLGQSLERLGTRFLDLYLLHRDDPFVPVEPIVDVLNHHAGMERIRAFGGSNWTHQRLQQANDYARASGLRPFSASSPNLSLAVPNEPMWPDCISVSGDREALDWYRATRFPLLSWSAQSGGFFSGRFSPDQTSDPSMVRVYYSDANWERYRRAERLGRELGYTPVQMALAWVLSQADLEVFALIGPRTVDELRSSLAVADLLLTPEQVAWLNLDPLPPPAGGQ